MEILLMEQVVLYTYTHLKNYKKLALGMSAKLTYLTPNSQGLVIASYIFFNKLTLIL